MKLCEILAIKIVVTNVFFVVKHLLMLSWGTSSVMDLRSLSVSGLSTSDTLSQAAQLRFMTSQLVPQQRSTTDLPSLSRAT